MVYLVRAGNRGVRGPDFVALISSAQTPNPKAITNDAGSREFVSEPGLLQGLRAHEFRFLHRCTDRFTSEQKGPK